MSEAKQGEIADATAKNEGLAKVLGLPIKTCFVCNYKASVIETFVMLQTTMITCKLNFHSCDTYLIIFSTGFHLLRILPLVND